MSALDSHALQRGVGGDASAKQRGHAGIVGLGKLFGNFDHEVTVDNDGAAVAAIGRVALDTRETTKAAGASVEQASEQNLFRDVVVLERVVVCEHTACTVLLREILAVGASAAAIDHASYADRGPDSQVLDVCTHRRNTPNDLVTGNHGKLCRSPVFTDLVHVCVADTREQNVDCDVVGSGGSADDGVRDEGALACKGSVRFSFAHV
jgi:hypothetical protein